MLKLIIRHRHLLWQFTKRQIEQRHRGSILGLTWSILQPLLMMGIYTIVFGLIFKGRYRGIENQSTIDYALGVFLSITLFQAISEIINNAPAAILRQPNLVKKVVFPLEILPLSMLGATLYQFIISIVLVLIGTVVIGQGLTFQSLLFVVAILPLIPIIIGLCLLLSALGVFLRDIQYAAGPVSTVLMYSSAVFYSAQMIPRNIWTWLKYNPLIHIIEQARAVLLWHQPLQWEGLTYSFAFGLALMALGAFTFKKLKPAFADVM